MSRHWKYTTVQGRGPASAPYFLRRVRCLVLALLEPIQQGTRGGR